jgi:serine phosphatase RsbU (regulator of sigma subunit)
LVRKRSTSDDPDVEALQRELTAARAALRQHETVAERRRRLEELSEALIGTDDPEVVYEQAARWATATLGLPCSIVATPPDGAVAFALGSHAPSWLLVDGGRALAEDDDAALRPILDRLTRAVDSAERVAAQARDLRTLERSLLPDALLSVPGLQLASRYVPAKGAHEVGGDFYDTVRVGDVVTLIVGDVQGKGIEAATLTSMARHTLRAAALDGQPPSDLLHRVNRALLYTQEEQASAGGHGVLRFVSAVVARLEPGDAGRFTVTVARAGQPPPIIVRSDGRFETLEPRGVLLGVTDAPVYESTTNHLDVGDTLVLYTDGVIEQRGGEHNALSEHHLGMLVRNRRGVVDAASIAALIEETVHLVAPEDIRDDVAILVACPVRT